MIPPTAPAQPYSTVRRRLQSHPVLATEIPTEHSRSLPLPTLSPAVAGAGAVRTGPPGRTGPAYAGFAGPALRRPGQPLRLSTPDRWWVVSATDQSMILYARTAAVPFPAPLPDGAVEVTSSRSLAAAREDLVVLDELLDAAVPAFFAGDDVDPASRAALLEQLAVVAGAGTVAWYRALVPDFFAWLEG